MALALRGFKDFRIVGMDISEETLAYAREHGVVDETTNDVHEAIHDADVVMLGMDPEGIIEFLEMHKDEFKPGSLVTDVCGVKNLVGAFHQPFRPPYCGS